MVKTFSIAHQDDSDSHLGQALVYNAGRLAWRIRESGLKTQQKTSVSDVVTQADHAAENFVVGVLENLRPDDGVQGEEGHNKEGSSGRNWIIDPVDGTYNFANGSDYFCSALALAKGKNPVFGAVHRPAMGYTWFGGPDIPTTRDGKEVRVMDNAPLSQRCLATYLHPDYFNTAIAQSWSAVVSGAASIRMLGAGSIDLASVADGSIGGWMQHSVPTWDWLPGKALVLGAGGVCSRIDAGGVMWNLAGSEEVVRDMEERLL